MAHRVETPIVCGGKTNLNDVISLTADVVKYIILCLREYYEGKEH